MVGTDIAIDLGTSLLKIYAQGKGNVVKVPSAVAFDTIKEEVIAVGREAYQMVGRTSERVEIVRPLNNGVISNFSMAQHLITHFIKQVSGNRMFMPRVVVSVPCVITEVQKRAVVDAISATGVRKICLIEEPVAAAMGAGVDISAPHGTFVVDIGGGTTDMAVISLNGIAISDSIPIAGDAFNDAIIKYIRRKYGVAIGERTAEDAKIAIGCAYPKRVLETYTVKGIHTVKGLPQSLEVTSDELMEALIEPAMQIVRKVQATLDVTPPELLADILTDGMVLTGGSSNLWGLATLLSKKTRIPVRLNEHPEDCVAMGAGKALSFIDVMDNRGGGTLNPLFAQY